MYCLLNFIDGDIGTSPLYVFSSTFTSDPSQEDLIGVLSIIIWTLTMMVTVTTHRLLRTAKAEYRRLNISVLSSTPITKAKEGPSAPTLCFQDMYVLIIKTLVPIC
jgi:hypothetical protein